MLVKLAELSSPFVTVDLYDFMYICPKTNGAMNQIVMCRSRSPFPSDISSTTIPVSLLAVRYETPFKEINNNLFKDPWTKSFTRCLLWELPCLLWSGLQHRSKVMKVIRSRSKEPCVQTDGDFRLVCFSWKPYGHFLIRVYVNAFCVESG